MKEKNLKQYEIKTDYVIHGERIYYIDAKNPKDAEKRFNKKHVHDTMVKDNIFMMEEHVKDVNSVENEVDVRALQEAQRIVEAEAWNTKMNEILGRNREKLRTEMGYGEKD